MIRLGTVLSDILRLSDLQKDEPTSTEGEVEQFSEVLRGVVGQFSRYTWGFSGLWGSSSFRGEVELISVSGLVVEGVP